MAVPKKEGKLKEEAKPEEEVKPKEKGKPEEKAVPKKKKEFKEEAKLKKKSNRREVKTRRDDGAKKKEELKEEAKPEEDVKPKEKGKPEEKAVPKRKEELKEEAKPEEEVKPKEKGKPQEKALLTKKELKDEAKPEKVKPEEKEEPKENAMLKKKEELIQEDKSKEDMEAKENAVPKVMEELETEENGELFELEWKKDRSHEVEESSIFVDAKVKLQTEPIIAQHPESQTIVVEKETATFTCKFKDVAEDVKWYRDERELWTQPNKVEIETNDKISTLIIRSVDHHDIGRYYVVVDDKEKSEEALLIYKVSPKLIYEGPTGPIVAGKHFDFEVKFSGYPTPQVTILLDGEDIKMHGTMETYDDFVSVRVKHVKHSGMIKINAVNEHGEESMDVSMEVLDVPSAPIDAVAKEVRATTVTISWSKPEFTNGSEITEYCVERKSVEYSRWRVIGRVPADCLSFTAHDLLSNDLYTFRVSAVNAIGQGKPSNAVEVETIEDNEEEGKIEHITEDSADRDVNQNGELPEEMEEEFVVIGAPKEKTLALEDASEVITLKAPRQEVDNELGEKSKQEVKIVEDLKKDEVEAKKDKDLREKVEEEKETKPIDEEDKLKEIAEKVKRKEEKEKDGKLKKEEPKEKSKSKQEFRPEEKEKSVGEVEKDKEKEKVMEQDKVTPIEERKPESKLETKEDQEIKEEVKSELRSEERMITEGESKPKEKPKKVKKSKEGTKKKVTPEEKAIPNEDHKQEEKVEVEVERFKEKRESEEEQKLERKVEPLEKVTTDKVEKKKVPKELTIPDEISTRFGEPSILHSETNITTKITAIEGSAEVTSPIKQPQSASISMKVEGAREAPSKTEKSGDDVFEFTIKKSTEALDDVSQEMSTELKIKKQKEALKEEEEGKKQIEDKAATEKTPAKKKRKKAVQKEEGDQKGTPKENGVTEKKDVEAKDIKVTEVAEIPYQKDEPIEKIANGRPIDSEPTVMEVKETLPEIIPSRPISPRKEAIIEGEVPSATSGEGTPQSGEVLSNLSSRRSSGSSGIGSYTISRRKMRKSGFISAPGPEVLALRGDTVRFECEVVNESDDVEWFINDKSYAAEPRSSEDVDGPFRSLTITDLTPEDTGMIVEVRLNENVVTSKLIVEEISAEITKRLDHKTTGQEGEPLTLTIALDHPAKEVKWYKDDEEITESLKYEIAVINNFCHLTIRKVEYGDAGQYMVVADGSKSYTNLRIMGKPRIRATEHVLIETERNKSIMLNVLFDCQEEPSATCLFNGEVLREDAKTQLEVHQNAVKFCKRLATKADSGEYTIKLSNEFGEDLERFTVKVKDVPGAPLSISVKEIGNDSISISWRKPTDDGGAPITGYVIEKKEDGRRTFHKVDQVSASKTSYVVEELEIATSYVLRVSAVNKYGPGESVETPVVTTSTPYMAPQIAEKPTISDITDDGCLLTWQKPLEDGGSPIYGYDVYRREDSGGWTKMNDDLVFIERYAITGLLPNVGYEFKVEACNEAGLTSDSNLSSEMLVITPTLGRPTSVPPIPRIFITSTDSVRLEWDIADEETSAEYTVSYKSEKSSIWTEVNCSVNSCSIDGLKEGVSYVFKVAARNEAGVGTFSEETPPIKLIPNVPPVITKPIKDDHYSKEDVH